MSVPEREREKGWGMRGRKHSDPVTMRIPQVFSDRISSDTAKRSVRQLGLVADAKGSPGRAVISCIDSFDEF
jgi:hypothetical protein